jgi:hypothetical protein
MRIGEAMNRSTAEANRASGGSAQNEPGVVDAEFEEVDKRDRRAG